MNREIFINLIICLACGLIYISITEPISRIFMYIISHSFADILFFTSLPIFFFLLTPLRKIDFAIQLSIHKRKIVKASVISILLINLLNILYGYFMFLTDEWSIEDNSSIFAQKWLFITFLICLSMSYIEKKKFFSTTYLISAALCGIVMFLFAFFVSFLIQDSRINQSLCTLLLFVMLPNVIDCMNLRMSIAKLKILNGPLRGYLFTLDNNSCLVGNQESDNINLSLYSNVNYSHAKITPFGPIHSIADNDPYCQTAVNYAHFTEKILKDGDIISIGSARLLYIYN